MACVLLDISKGLGSISLFVILFIGANGLGDGCLFVCYHFDWRWLLAGFLIFFSIVFDGSRGGFVVVFFAFHFSIRFDGSEVVVGGGWLRHCWPHHAPQLRQAVARKNSPAENVELFTIVFNCKIRSTNND